MNIGKKPEPGCREPAGISFILEYGQSLYGESFLAQSYQHVRLGQGIFGLSGIEANRFV